MNDALPAAKPHNGWLNIILDYGPIVLFFLVYRHYSPSNHNDAVGEILAVVRSTVAFMVAAVIALLVSKIKFGHASPMLWLSTALIVGFGGLTVLLHDPFWIQIKPTAIYLMFGGALLIGVWRGQALLKTLLEAAFEGLNEHGWMVLSRNWGLFFLLMAVANEVFRHLFNAANGGFGTWIALKLWVFMPASFLFTLAHIPFLLKNGLGDDQTEDIAKHTPHE